MKWVTIFIPIEILIPIDHLNIGKNIAFEM